MTLDSTSKIKIVAKSWFFWLMIILVVAIILRSIPAWTNAAWGGDFGIYYGLSKSFVETKEVFNSYNGWGGSYQYFPVLYAITGITHWITGLDVITILPKIAPIFGGLSIFIFYFIVYHLVGDRKKALLTSLLFSVLPFHVYQTSHAAPLTMGHFFMMLSLYLFLRFRQKTWFILPLFISTILLIMSHHFTTYFYIISIISIVFFENIGVKNWTSSLKKDVTYILLTSFLVFSYWVIIAKPVYEDFMSKGLNIGGFYIGSIYVIILFYLVLFAMFMLIWFKRKLGFFAVKKPPTAKKSLLVFLVFTITLFASACFFIFEKLPWTNFSFTPLSVLYSIPFILICGFAAAGLGYIKVIQNGDFIRGWFFGIFLSFLYALVTNGFLFPDRHLEYLMAPISIFAVYGIQTISTIVSEKISGSKEKIEQTIKPSFYFFKKYSVLKRSQFLYIAVVLLLTAAVGSSVYPSNQALNIQDESITRENLVVITWLEENIDRNGSVIASDHRLSRLVEASGFNTTLDEARDIWVAENFTDYSSELYGVGKNYSKISHVLIDDIMKEDVVWVGLWDIVYMTNESYEKFSYEPFELLYRNATLNEDMEEVHWTEVYFVNWTYIEKYLESS
ncbi:MAG: hypothetical protein QHH19_00270 [Candidatus Thermoplasmatota archaeon]|jgi:hypothetical protein|nr:hypothetical protein [Candidatus Thermoplasmatota archaeon]